MKVTDRIAVHRAAWHTATVVETVPETPGSRRLVLDVPTWPGNDAGAHLDIRLTAPDGYQASRAYSIASAVEATRLTLVVDRLEYGEVSPFLVDELRVGDQLEVHGPLGRFFLWHPPTEGDGAQLPPVQLIGAGSGIVPLFAMAAAHAASGDMTRFRLLYSVRDPEHVFFRKELAEAAKRCPGPLEIDFIYTREAPDGWPTVPGRVTRDVLASHSIPPSEMPRIYLCGPTPFVEMVSMWLVEAGHDPAQIRAERFGGA
tara:strand:+ start:915 stop:1688 length:774 start_codon:yes stop_codon:yes gene_type:complete